MIDNGKLPVEACWLRYKRIHRTLVVAEFGNPVGDRGENVGSRVMVVQFGKPLAGQGNATTLLLDQIWRIRSRRVGVNCLSERIWIDFLSRRARKMTASCVLLGPVWRVLPQWVRVQDPVDCRTKV